MFPDADHAVVDLKTSAPNAAPSPVMNEFQPDEEIYIEYCVQYGLRPVLIVMDMLDIPTLLIAGATGVCANVIVVPSTVKTVFLCA